MAEGWKHFEAIKLKSTSTQNSQNLPTEVPVLSPTEISPIFPDFETEINEGNSTESKENSEDFRRRFPEHRLISQMNGRMLNEVKPIVINDESSQSEMQQQSLEAFQYQPKKSNLQTFESIASENAAREAAELKSIERMAVEESDSQPMIIEIDDDSSPEEVFPPKSQPTTSKAMTTETVPSSSEADLFKSQPKTPESSQKHSKPTPLSDKIFKIMESENRPLIMSAISAKVGTTYDKKMIEKLLQEMVEQGKIISKSLGKIVIYCINNKFSAGAVSVEKITVSLF